MRMDVLLTTGRSATVEEELGIEQPVGASELGSAGCQTLVPQAARAQSWPAGIPLFFQGSRGAPSENADSDDPAEQSHSDAGRFHVNGYREEGTTTTPFDMLVRNGISRLNVVIQAAGRIALRSPEEAALAESVIREAESRLEQHAAYILREGTDPPELDDWRDALAMRKV